MFSIKIEDGRERPESLIILQSTFIIIITHRTSLSIKTTQHSLNLATERIYCK